MGKKDQVPIRKSAVRLLGIGIAALLMFSFTIRSVRSRDGRALLRETEVASVVLEQEPHHRLLTVREMKERMVLPCNNVHDGRYIRDSNEVLNQVHQSIMYHLEDDIIPVIIEVGGHDGITKSQTLKASRCLAVNTLLIEASRNNYNVLKQARGNYYWTVNAALCDGDSIEMVENAVNSGETHVLREGEDVNNTKRVITHTRCTSIDAELDELAATLPVEQRSKLQLIFLVLDVEGHEASATDGIQKYTPHKVFMEEQHLKPTDRKKIAQWADSHGLKGKTCTKRDTCYNFDPLIAHARRSPESSERVKSLLYGARLRIPDRTARTSRVAQSYWYYGE